MSGSAKSTSAAAAALAQVFVVQFGSRFNNKRKKKKSQDDNGYWHVCDSLCRIPPALSFSFSAFLLIFLVILCSNGGVKGSEISTSSLTALSNNNGVPTFDINDLKNLIEIFPEFREYVYRVVSSHLEKQKPQQQQTLYRNNENSYVATTTPKAAIFPVSSPTSGYGETSTNSRKDWFSYSPQKINHAPAQKAAPAKSKHSYGWSHYDDYHNHDYDHSSHYGYGYEPAPTPGWGWTSDPHDDQKFHYQVGYNLGKDLSCLLGLIGFKSIKDFSIYSVFSFFKKLKYLVLIGLAFKLGVILSPIALPMLFPIILLGVIAKILPLLLIIVLLFKLLKTQLKFGIGKRTGKASGDIGSSVGTVSNLLEGTNISRLWESIDDVTNSVAENDTCVEKIICKMIQKRSEKRSNSTLMEDIPETKRSIGSSFLKTTGMIAGRFLLNTMTDWIFQKRKWKVMQSDLSGDIWECDKIQCKENS